MSNKAQNEKRLEMDHGDEEWINGVINDPEQLDNILSIGRAQRILNTLDRLRQDRRDALTVYSKDGLLSSEWVARTGAAERELKAERAHTERLQSRLGGLVDGLESRKWLMEMPTIQTLVAQAQEGEE